MNGPPYRWLVIVSSLAALGCGQTANPVDSASRGTVLQTTVTPVRCAPDGTCCESAESAKRPVASRAVIGAMSCSAGDGTAAPVEKSAP